MFVILDYWSDKFSCSSFSYLSVIFFFTNSAPLLSFILQNWSNAGILFSSFSYQSGGFIGCVILSSRSLMVVESVRYLPRSAQILIMAAMINLKRQKVN